MISGCETMTCTGNRACAMKPVTFSLMVLLNVVQCYFRMYNIHVNVLCNEHYVPIVLILLSGKLESIYCSMWSAIKSLWERRNLTLGPTTFHIDFEVAIHTVLKNAQCTFKNELSIMPFN